MALYTNIFNLSLLLCFYDHFGSYYEMITHKILKINYWYSTGGRFHIKNLINISFCERRYKPF